MAISEVTQRDTQLEKQRAGFMALTLTNFDNTSEPAISAGSVVELAGALYSITSAESIGGAASAGANYIYFLSDGSAFQYSTTAPTWNDAKQGFYNGSNDRAISLFILSGSNYTDKRLITNVWSGRRAIEYWGETNTYWLCPQGVNEVIINAVGQGGRGGDRVGNNGGGGGGSGAWCRNHILSVTPGNAYQIILSTTGNSSFFGLTLGKGSDASGRIGGAGGIGDGGASNGRDGGDGYASAGANTGGGGGGGIGSEGDTATGITSRPGGGTITTNLAGNVSAYGGFIGGSGGDAFRDGGIGGGGGGGNPPGTSAAGGGGGGSSNTASLGAPGGPPYLRIEF